MSATAEREASPTAMIPDQWGVAIIDVYQFVAYLAEGEPLDEAIRNATFDSFDGTPEHVQRVRQLNATGDAAAYWDTH